MSRKRKERSAKFKLMVALEAIKEHKTSSQIASEYQVTTGQVSTWKKRLISQGETVFEKPQGGQEKERSSQEAELYEQIGRLKMELEWLKKKAALFD